MDNWSLVYLPKITLCLVLLRTGTLPHNYTMGTLPHQPRSGNPHLTQPVFLYCKILRRSMKLETPAFLDLKKMEIFITFSS